MVERSRSGETAWPCDPARVGSNTWFTSVRSWVAPVRRAAPGGPRASPSPPTQQESTLPTALSSGALAEPLSGIGFHPFITLNYAAETSWLAEGCDLSASAPFTAPKSPRSARAGVCRPLAQKLRSRRS